MKDIYITIYTKSKEKDKLTFTREEMLSREEWMEFDRYINFHREDGPAVEWANGTKEWFIDGKCHREDGPAIEFSNGSKEWFIDGILHREDGPAIEYSNGSSEWFLDGIDYSEEAFDKIIEEVGSLDPVLGLIDPREWVRKRFSKKFKEEV